MALFQRIKPPFAEDESEGEVLLSSGMRSAGDVLQQQRAALGLDLNQVAAMLKIKPAYLAAIEEGRLDQLPGATYAVGFVRSYSEHLGLDSAEILRRFKLEAAGLDAKPSLTFPMPLGERSLPGNGTLLLAAILVISGYGVWYYLTASERSLPPRVTEVPAALLRPEPEPAKSPGTSAPVTPAPVSSGPAAVEANSAPRHVTTTDKAAATAEVSVAPSAAVTPSSLPVPPSGTGDLGSTAAFNPSSATPASAMPATAPAVAPAPTPQATPEPSPTEALASPPQNVEAPGVYGAVDGSSRIVLRAVADSWIQIRAADHSVLFTGLLKPGDTYRVPDGPGLSMRAGNAGGLDITVDGKPAPSLGPVGAVRNVALDPQSLMAQSPAHD